MFRVATLKTRLYWLKPYNLAWISYKFEVEEKVTEGNNFLPETQRILDLNPF